MLSSTARATCSSSNGPTREARVSRRPAGHRSPVTRAGAGRAAACDRCLDALPARCSLHRSGDWPRLARRPRDPSGRLSNIRPAIGRHEPPDDLVSRQEQDGTADVGRRDLPRPRSRSSHVTTAGSDSTTRSRPWAPVATPRPSPRRPAAPTPRPGVRRSAGHRGRRGGTGDRPSPGRSRGAASALVRPEAGQGARLVKRPLGLVADPARPRPAREVGAPMAIRCRFLQRSRRQNGHRRDRPGTHPDFDRFGRVAARLGLLQLEHRPDPRLVLSPGGLGCSVRRLVDFLGLRPRDMELFSSQGVASRLRRAAHHIAISSARGRA